MHRVKVCIHNQLLASPLYNNSSRHNSLYIVHYCDMSSLEMSGFVLHACIVILYAFLNFGVLRESQSRKFRAQMFYVR